MFILWFSNVLLRFHLNFRYGYTRQTGQCFIDISGQLFDSRGQIVDKYIKTEVDEWLSIAIQQLPYAWY